MKSFKLLKTLTISVLTALSLWTAPAFAQGTIPLAMAVQADSGGNPVPGCLLYSYVAGTVATPQNAFADFGLTQALPNPVQCDQGSRVPMLWYANGLIHVRLTDATGLVIIDTTMQVLGPSSGGGGGGGTVDPTSIMATGDEKTRYGTGPLSGFVRENGLTIGSSVSGATERANADTQALFIYLYGADPNLVVSGGRTGNALNDFNANKTIALPDMRGRINAFLDDMGNTAAGRLTSSYFGSSATVLGHAGGLQDMPGLGTGNLPPYTPAGANSIPNVTMLIGGSGGPEGVINGSGAVPTGTGGSSGFTTSAFGTLSATVTAPTFGGTAQGGTSTPFSILPPIMLRTQYMKL
jgi:hypothetical protein